MDNRNFTRAWLRTSPGASGWPISCASWTMPMPRTEQRHAQDNLTDKIEAIREHNQPDGTGTGAVSQYS